MSRYWKIMGSYAVIHALGWLLHAFFRESFPMRPEPTNSMLLAFALTWAGEKP